MTAKALQKLGQDAWELIPVSLFIVRESGCPPRRAWLQVEEKFANENPETTHLTYRGALIR